MARDEQRAALLVLRRNGHLLQAIQTFEHCLNAPAPFDVDDRVRREIHEIACADHIRPAKHDDAVAVGVARLVEDLDRLTIEVQVLLGFRVGVVRPGSFSRRSSAAGWRAHPLQNGAECNDVRPRRSDEGIGGRVGILQPAEPVVAVEHADLPDGRYRPPGLSDVRVTADVIRLVARVDDVDKWLLR